MDLQDRLDRTHDGLATTSDAVYQSIRELAHFASDLRFLPAPALYRALGENKAALWAYADAVQYLSAALMRSLDQPGLTITDSDVATGQDCDPAASLHGAQANLERVEALLREAGNSMETAQGCISGQGYEVDKNST